MRRALAQWLSVTCRVSAVSQQRSVVTVSVALDDDTEQELLVQPGTTLLEAIDASDFSDVWEGGACGGSCACSTCRVIVDEAWGGKLAAPDDDELDLLDDGAAQAAKASGAAAAERAQVAAAYTEGARLSCQIEIDEELDGLRVAIPESLFNLLEIPLHMRAR